MKELKEIRHLVDLLLKIRHSANNAGIVFYPLKEEIESCKELITILGGQVIRESLELRARFMGDFPKEYPVLRTNLSKTLLYPEMEE